MSAMKTPGVYVLEKNAFPNSVVEVATAVPAFIGYTEFAQNGNKSLLNIPWKISSLAEYLQYFGGAPVPKFTIEETKATEADLGESSLVVNGKDYKVKREDPYNLYFSIRFFFANGGGTCYIVSVDEGYENGLEKGKLENGIQYLVKEQEPTIVLVPEAVYLEDAQECYDIQTAMLQHCGKDMRNRVALLDVYGGYKDRKDATGDSVGNFRDKIGTAFLDFGAAYYPWLNTSIVPASDITYENIPDLDGFIGILTDSEPENSPTLAYINKIKTPDPEDTIDVIHKVLSKHSEAYREFMKEMLLILNILPPACAMAGIYTLVDQTKEVWKAPANISLSNVVSPVVNISHADQEDLNVPLNGKAVNAIRYFVNEGVKVWGARTLDGNSLDWRYINVRRTMIMLEESIKNATKAFVFEPNTANTWVNVRGTIANFLNGIWKRGGLAGSSPDEAFSVHIGLGATMTPEDILEGIMRVTVLVAIVRPAEFIEITFQQQMQKS